MFDLAPWNHNLVRAALDLHEQNYSQREALQLLQLPTQLNGNYGLLDPTDEQAIDWAFSKEPKYPPRQFADIGKWTLSTLYNACKPYLDRNFLLLRQNDGIFRTFKINKNFEVNWIRDDAIIEANVSQFLTKQYGQFASEKKLKEAVRMWKYHADGLTEEPLTIAFKNDPGYAYRRLSYDPTPGPIDAWDEFLTRLTDATFFKAFVWSIFVRRNKSRRVMYLSGDGQDGKTTVLNAIAECLGQGCASLSNTSVQNDRFLLARIHDKALVIYPDCKNSKFLMKELVRNITSGDLCTIDEKFQKTFEKVIRVKLIVASNLEPEITGQRADTSRLAWIKVAASKTMDDPSWEERLVSQLPHFLWECKKTYAEVCPHHGDIPLGATTTVLSLKAASDFEELYSEIFHKHFALNPNQETYGSDIVAILKFFDLRDTQRQKDFYNWLHRNFGLEKTADSNGRKVVKGLVIKTF